jgi:two-component system chemotaxis sensor kinase CheA
MDHPFGELIHEYVAECLPMAEAAADGFIEVERRWTEGRSADDLFPPLKNSLHTIKGNSGMMGLDDIQRVAHVIEDLCAFLLGSAAFRGERTAALLVEGGGILVDAIRVATDEKADRTPMRAYARRTRDFLAAPEPDRRSRGPRKTPESGTPVPAGQAGPDRSLDTVRVDFRRLDAMLEILGEAVIAHSALAEGYRHVAARFGREPEVRALDRTVETLGKTVKRMESALMETRLLPVSTVFAKFTRHVRDLAHSKGKKARVVLEGGDLLLDKTILDRLGEPLLHMVRNAMAHGVESPAARQKAGKPAEGTITLRAAAQADRMVVTVSDDGRGLDRDRILARAESLGLATPGATLEQICGWIFLPNFSTADVVSELSGRGVGLDVVAASLHAMGGTVDVASQPLRGTTFTLSFPLTLAVVKSLILEVDRERYAMPLSHVAETVRVGNDTVQAINRRGVTIWRDDLIYVADGGTLLGTRPTEAGQRRYCVVIAAGAKRRGVLVDRLVGHQDVVVKALDSSLGRLQFVSGATILGDGRVACILDATRIVDYRPGAADAVPALT